MKKSVPSTVSRVQTRGGQRALENFVQISLKPTYSNADEGSECIMTSVDVEVFKPCKICFMIVPETLAAEHAKTHEIYEVPKPFRRNRAGSIGTVSSSSGDSGFDDPLELCYVPPPETKGRPRKKRKMNIPLEPYSDEDEGSMSIEWPEIEMKNQDYQEDEDIEMEETETLTPFTETFSQDEMPISSEYEFVFEEWSENGETYQPEDDDDFLPIIIVDVRSLASSQ